MNVERRKSSLRKNDHVQVIAGREKGKTGKILKIDSKTGRVTVEKINVVKRHVKPTQVKAGGIVERELPLHYSNVLLHCPKCDRGVRHSHKLVDKPGSEESVGTTKRQVKIRVCKRCNEQLDIA